MKAKITGIGKYSPERILTNSDLEKLVDTNDEWISTRTGIKERHIASLEETTSTMASEAVKIALAMAKISKEEIDMIVFATVTPDMVFPATSCLLQDLLKIPAAGTMDVSAACSGFLYALSIANAYIVSGMYKNVLVVASETLSRFTDWQDRGTCILFGDGAGAAVVSATEDTDESGFIGFKLGGDGSYRDLLYLPAGGSRFPASFQTINDDMHFIKMEGNSTFKVAVRTMADVMAALLKDKGFTVDDLKLLIPHQANLRIIESVGERLGINKEKVFVNVQKYGNTSAASIPIALTEAYNEGRIQKGDLIGLVAFGGGFTWGATLIRW